MYQSVLANAIMRIKKARSAHPEYTYQYIESQTGVSKSTITRVFQDGSEEQSFRLDSIKLLHKFFYGTDVLEEDISYEDFQLQVSQLKDKYERKLEKEREQKNRSIEFLKHQIELKDDRITLLLNALDDRSAQFKDLLDKYNSLLTQLLNNNEEVNKNV